MGPNSTIMPVSVCDSPAVSVSSAIGSAIRDSLSSSTNNNNNGQQSATASTLHGHSNGLNGQLAASVKRSLLTKIDYEEAPPNFKNSIHDELREKYVFLNTANGSMVTNKSLSSVSNSTTNKETVPFIGPGKFRHYFLSFHLFLVANSRISFLSVWLSAEKIKRLSRCFLGCIAVAKVMP